MKMADSEQSQETQEEGEFHSKLLPSLIQRLYKVLYMLVGLLFASFIFFAISLLSQQPQVKINAYLEKYQEWSQSNLYSKLSQIRI